MIAVDWSGRATGAAETIWRAVARDGRLVDLDNGLDRDETVATIIALAAGHRRTAVGLDFSFSLPAWYCAQRGWRTGPQVWDGVRRLVDDLLAAPEPPFWGRAGSIAQRLGDPYRQTEKVALRRPKSTFQIGGAGSVGTGSLRGMPYLADLREAGFSVWPFDPPGWPRVVEIYPRLFVPDTVVKSRHRSRRDHLTRLFPEQDRVLLERAAGSEDAFDAAVSALAMARHEKALTNLPLIPPGSPEHLEGAIWTPNR